MAKDGTNLVNDRHNARRMDMFDFAVLGDAWFSDPNMTNWEAGCDISEPEDEVIDRLALAVFVGNWLEGID